MFNYVITIHNKEGLLPRVLEGIASCCSKHSKIIPVLDGCSDRSEEIVDDFMACSALSVEKVITPDVFELRTLNAGMAQVREGFVVCVQDDVILQEPELEAKISALYEKVGPTLGVVSPRHGMNVRRTPFLRQLRQSGLVPLIDEFERVTRPTEAVMMSDRVDYGHFAFRMVAGGSPFIIPERVWRELGWLDDEMAPYQWFDHEYSLRALVNGFRNVVFPLTFESRAEWGTSRQQPYDPVLQAKIRAVDLRNRRYLWKKYGQFINTFLKQQGKHTWAWK